MEAGKTKDVIRRGCKKWLDPGCISQAELTRCVMEGETKLQREVSDVAKVSDVYTLERTFVY